MSKSVDHNQWRLDLLRQVADHYAASANIGAAVVAGSVARGRADRFSDIELHLFWNEAPTIEERIDLAEKAGGTIHVRWDEPPSNRQFLEIHQETQARFGQVWPIEDSEWSDLYYRDGVAIDVSGFLCAQAEQYLVDVCQELDPTDPKQMLLAAIEDGIPLVGVEKVEAWKSRIEFPEGLRAPAVTPHLSYDRDWGARSQLLDRGELALLYGIMADMRTRILRILLALNQVFVPDTRLKWLEVWGHKLGIAPERLIERMNAAFTTQSASEAVDELQALAEETYDLIDRELPQLDPVLRHRWFRALRPIWDESPYPDVD